MHHSSYTHSLWHIDVCPLWRNLIINTSRRKRVLIFQVIFLVTHPHTHTHPHTYTHTHHHHEQQQQQQQKQQRNLIYFTAPFFLNQQQQSISTNLFHGSNLLKANLLDFSGLEIRLDNFLVPVHGTGKNRAAFTGESEQP